MTDLSNFQMGELMLGKSVKAKSETKVEKNPKAKPEPALEKRWVTPGLGDQVEIKGLMPREKFGLLCDKERLIQDRKEGAYGHIVARYKGTDDLVLVEVNGRSSCYHVKELWVET